MGEKIMTNVSAYNGETEEERIESKIAESQLESELESESESESESELESKSYFLSAQNSAGDDGRVSHPLPPWVNPEKIHQGQEFVRENFFSIFFAHFISLIFLLCYGPIRSVLLRTGKSDTKWKSLKRYLSTLIHIKKWYELEILRENGEAAEDVRMVRQIHSKVARCIRKADEIKSRTKTKADSSKLFSSSSSSLSLSLPLAKSKHQTQVEAQVSQIPKPQCESESESECPSPLVHPTNDNNNNNNIKGINDAHSHFNLHKPKPSHCCRSVENPHPHPHPKCMVNYVIVEEHEKGKDNYGNYDDVVTTNLSLSANLIRAVQRDFANVTHVTSTTRKTAQSATMNERKSNINNHNTYSNNHNNNNSYFPELKRKENENGNYVITQLDMMVTQFCFMGFITMYPRHFGLTHASSSSSSSSNSNPNSNSESIGQGYGPGHEGFIHLWALIGHLLGIDDKFNLCLDSNRHRLPSILNHLLLPELTDCDANTVTLWSSLIDGIAAVIPFVSLRPILLFVRQLFIVQKEEKLMLTSNSNSKEKSNQDNGFELISQFSTYDHICFCLLNMCFSSWLQFKLCRLMFNNLLRLAVYLSVIRFNVYTGARRFQEKSNKDYDYYNGNAIANIPSRKCIFSRPSISVTRISTNGDSDNEFNSRCNNNCSKSIVNCHSLSFPSVSASVCINEY